VDHPINTKIVELRVVKSMIVEEEKSHVFEELGKKKRCVDCGEEKEVLRCALVK
jgi:hypothetical protein